MARTTIYVAQPFELSHGRYKPGQLRVFACAHDAECAGLKMASSNDGVIVFSQQGDPEWDVWDEADVLLSHGFVPRDFVLAA